MTVPCPRDTLITLSLREGSPWFWLHFMNYFWLKTGAVTQGHGSCHSAPPPSLNPRYCQQLLFKGEDNESALCYGHSMLCTTDMYGLCIHVIKKKTSCCPAILSYKISCLFLTTNHSKLLTLVKSGLRQRFLFYTFLCWVNFAQSEYIIFIVKKNKKYLYKGVICSPPLPHSPNPD